MPDCGGNPGHQYLVPAESVLKNSCLNVHCMPALLPNFAIFFISATKLVAFFSMLNAKLVFLFEKLVKVVYLCCF